MAAGCGSPADGVTFYEAGVYKGKPDPLVDTLETGDVQEALQRRLDRGQTDRLSAVGDAGQESPAPRRADND